jgi:polyisoprenoid-binding protein YceI
MRNSLILVIFFLCSQIAIAESSVKWEGTGSPGFLSIEGKGGKVKGAIKTDKDGKVSGTFDFDLSTLDSGIELRNDHMKNKYLEIKKFPTASLVLNPTVMPKQGYFNWTGSLTLHGVTNKVGGVAFLEGKQIEAKFSIETPDYKIKKATYMGVGLDDKINIVVLIDSPS